MKNDGQELIGTLLRERYLIVSGLGAGLQADTYLAEDTLLQGQVVVKVLRDEVEGFEMEIPETWVEEARKAMKVRRHPNVASVIDIATEIATLSTGARRTLNFIVWEYIPGESLSDIMRAPERLTVEFVIRFVLEMLDAVKNFAQHKFVHGDLHDHNILIDFPHDGTGELKISIIDFGLAHTIAGGANPLTDVQAVVRHALKMCDALQMQETVYIQILDQLRLCLTGAEKSFVDGNFRFPQLVSSVEELEKMYTYQAMKEKAREAEDAHKPFDILNEQYEFQRFIGEGGMGSIHLCRAIRAHAGMARNQLVVIKILHSHLARDESVLTRFVQEARLAMKAESPTVAKVFEVGPCEIGEERRYFIAMEYIAGKTICDAYKEVRPPSDELLWIGSECARALHALHSAGVIHRDIKPENIMLSDDGELKLIDLGLAKSLEASLAISQSGVFVGTVQYAAPEQFQEEELDGRCDQYSLGVMLYELATGVNPFSSGNLPKVIHNHINLLPKPPSSINREISKFADRVILRMLEKYPSDRFHSMSEVIEVIKSGEPSLVPALTWESLPEDQSGAPVESFPALVIPDEPGIVDELYDGVVIGREREAAALDDALDEVRRRKEGRTVCLIGEVGAGKTAFLDKHFTEGGFHLQDYRTIRVEIEHYEHANPYRAVLAAVSAMLGLPDFDGRSELREEIGEKLKSQLGRGGRQAALLAQLLIDGDHQAAERGIGNLPHFLADFFLESSRHRGQICLVFDALESAPGQVLEFIESLSERHRRGAICLVLAFQPFAAFWRIIDYRAAFNRSDFFHKLVAQPQTTAVEMDGLNEMEVRTLLIRRFGEESFCERLMPLIYRESEGNPLLVDEILGLMKKARAIFYNGLEWRFALEEGELPFPPTTMENFYPRFQTLEEDDIRLLKCAATIGMEFNCSIIAHCLGSHKLHWDQCLERIAGATRLVKKLGRDWRFGHYQFGKAAYRLLTDDERREYHITIADYYRREHPELLEQNIETVVRHLCSAGLTREAVELLEKLAEQARLNHEENIAADYYNLALQQLGRLPENKRIREARADILLELGQTQLRQGTTMIARETLQQALNSSVQIGDKLRANSAQNLLYEVEDLEEGGSSAPPRLGGGD